MSDTTFGSVTADARREASDAASTVSDMTSRAKEKAADVASRVQETATDLGNRAAEKFNATTSYFREREVREIVSDVNEYVKANPTKALIGAAAVGFLAAVLIRRS